jgi:hypothetical protein
MSTNRRTETTASDESAARRSPLRREPNAPIPSMLATRIHHAQTAQEAEERYVTCRTEWVAAMKAAASGRPSDMAALAIAQEAYESALLEAERWRSGHIVAVPVEPEPMRDLEAIVGQELSWRQVHAPPSEDAPPAKKAGPLRRVLGRLTGR